MLLSARTGDGMDDAWIKLEEYRQVLTEHGELERRRGLQRKKWMWNYIQDQLLTTILIIESSAKLVCTAFNKTEKDLFTDVQQPPWSSSETFRTRRISAESLLRTWSSCRFAHQRVYFEKQITVTLSVLFKFTLKNEIKSILV